MHMFYYVMKGI